MCMVLMVLEVVLVVLEVVLAVLEVLLQLLLPQLLLLQLLLLQLRGILKLPSPLGGGILFSASGRTTFCPTKRGVLGGSEGPQEGKT